MTGAAIGIDIGGTSVVGALVAPDGRLLARRRIPTNSTAGIDDGLARLRALAADLLVDADYPAAAVAGIGIGSSGPVDAAAGVIRNPYTLPGWDGIPVVAALSQAFATPTLLLGDCQVAALGEGWRGAGQGARNLIYLTVGTGIGGALLVSGRLYRGLGDASEMGHQQIDPAGPLCYCGARGCLEILAAGPAIAEAARAAPPDSLLWRLAGGDPASLSAKRVVEAAGAGDPFAAALVERVGAYLGHGLANLINAVAPDCVVLGGGVMLGWAAFAPAALGVVRARCGIVPVERVAIRTAQLGLDAGVTGAARAVWLTAAGAL